MSQTRSMKGSDVTSDNTKADDITVPQTGSDVTREVMQKGSDVTREVKRK